MRFLRSHPRATIVGLSLSVAGATLWVVLAKGCMEERNVPDELPDARSKEMERLIARLAYASSRPVKVMGDLIIYEPDVDETVRDEVLAKGKTILPYLIDGLHNKDKRIRNECVSLLPHIPTKSGLEAIVGCLRVVDKPIPSSIRIRLSLHVVTGIDVATGRLVTDPDYLDGIRETWVPWWEKNKDRIVDTEYGIAFRQDDGSLRPMGRKLEDQE